MEGRSRPFLDHNIDERFRQFFMRSAKQVWPKQRAERMRKDDLLVMIPSFTITELTAAFQIGFVLYLRSSSLTWWWPTYCWRSACT